MGRQAFRERCFSQLNLPGALLQAEVSIEYRILNINYSMCEYIMLNLSIFNPARAFPPRLFRGYTPRLNLRQQGEIRELRRGYYCDTSSGYFYGGRSLTRNMVAALLRFMAQGRWRAISKCMVTGGNGGAMLAVEHELGQEVRCPPTSALLLQVVCA